jgi:hypothetical protein
MLVNKKNRAIVLAAVAIGSTAFVTSAAKATILAGWTFENDAVAINNSPAPSSGAGTASSIGMGVYPTPQVGTTTDDVLLGKNSDTGANGVADKTNTWRIRAQATSPNAANGWSSVAPIATQGAVFAVNPGANTSVNVSFDWYATTQGEANLELEYTTDGTDFINVPLTLSGSDAGLVVMTGNALDPNTTQGSYVSDNILNAGESTVAGQDWFTDLTATITDPNMLNDASFAIEMVNASTGTDCVSTQGTALNNNSGNWRFDNVSISTVPEPASAGLMAFAAMCLGVRRRVRR